MNLIDKFKIKEKVNDKKDLFRIYIKCDANDGDYIDGHIDISREKFSKDILLQYVISYVSRKCFGKFNPTRSWNGGYYGHHICKNGQFSWLERYCLEHDLLYFAGMCDMPCHSISDVSMSYFDEKGMEYNVEIPDFDKLFETIEEAQELMNNLAEKEGYSCEE